MTATRKDGIFESERAGRAPPVQHGPSQTIVPRSPAGGEVDRSQYAGRTPKAPPMPSPTLEPRR